LETAFVCESFLPINGGTERQFYELARQFLLKNHKVSVLTTRFNGLASEENLRGISIRRVGAADQVRYFSSPFGRNIRYSLEITSLFNRNLDAGADCFLYSEFPLFHLMGRQRVGPPAIGVWCECPANFSRFPLNLILRNLESRALRKCDSIICVNQQLQSALKLKYSMSAKYISNGVDFHRFKQTRPEAVITCIGRLVSHKNVEMAIRAMPYLEGYNLEIIGDGLRRSALEVLSRSLGVQEHVNFHGALTDAEIVEILGHTFVLILPSLREGSSLVALESMAAGVPVITTKARLNGTVGETVIDGYNGLVLDSFDPRDLAKNIVNLRNDPEKYYELSVNALNFAKERDWSNIAEKYLRHIGRLILNECWRVNSSLSA
jgi:glycosyltransferase involved in cell wall biosynthesis